MGLIEMRFLNYNEFKYLYLTEILLESKSLALCVFQVTFKEQQ